MEFVDRQEELDFLNSLLEKPPTHSAQFVLMYGRRRVGKTRLLRHWISQTELPSTYWVAEKENAASQRRKFLAEFEQRPVRHAPLYDNWAEVWSLVANRIGDQRYILVIDELPYAAHADHALLSSLQHAWDRLFENSNLILVVCGSQMRVMETLQFHQSPLFGRFTATWYLEPMPFRSLGQFFPNWSIDELVALYAIVGGIPAYLRWLYPHLSLVENIREVVLSPGSLFIAEPAFLLYDEVTEPQSYLSILKAIGAGNHTLDAISNASLIGKSHLSSYLARLQELKFVERRLPVTIPAPKRRTSRKGRYHLKDPYFHFYFRFLAPFYDILPDDVEPVLAKVRSELRAFVGLTAFETLCRQWVRMHRDQFDFIPLHVGSHWSRKVQIDVVAINWETRDILLGECKWGESPIGRGTIRELIEEKTQKVLAELPHRPDQWRVQPLFFARAGFTDSALAYAAEQKMRLINLDDLGEGLGWNV